MMRRSVNFRLARYPFDALFSAPFSERLPLVEDRVRDRRARLSKHLGDAEWLDGA